DEGAVAELAVGVPSPAVDRTAGAEAAGVALTGADLDPVGGSAHAGRDQARVAVPEAQLAVGVGAPAEQLAGAADAAGVDAGVDAAPVVARERQGAGAAVAVDRVVAEAAVLVVPPAEQPRPAMLL